MANVLAAAGHCPEKVGYDNLAQAGVIYKGLLILGEGAILAGLVLGAITAFIIDRRFYWAAGFAAAGAALSFIGLIHGEKVEWNANGQVALGYLFVAVVCLVFSLQKAEPLDHTEELEVAGSRGGRVDHPAAGTSDSRARCCDGGGAGHLTMAPSVAESAATPTGTGVAGEGPPKSLLAVQAVRLKCVGFGWSDSVKEGVVNADPIQEVGAAFIRYEQALVDGDVAVMTELFAAGRETVRFGYHRLPGRQRRARGLAACAAAAAGRPAALRHPHPAHWTGHGHRDDPVRLPRRPVGGPSIAGVVPAVRWLADRARARLADPGARRPTARSAASPGPSRRPSGTGSAERRQLQARRPA